MKKGLLAIVFAIGMIGSTNAQTQDFCFTDGFGYTASVTATWMGMGYWTLSGSGDVFLGYDWSISGYLDKASDTWSITWTNTMPDGCVFYVDWFTYTSTSHGGGIYFNWESGCDGIGVLGTGTGYTQFNQGLCPFRLSETVNAGPTMTDLSLASIGSEFKGIAGASIFDMLVEPSINVVRKDNNTFEIGYELLADSDVSIEIYNQVGQHVGTVVSGNQTKGYYIASWDASASQNGMYVAVMNMGTGTISKQFVK